MQPNLERKFKTMAWICLFTSFAGVIFQLVGEQRLDYNSVLIGFPLGVVFGLLELFLFPKAETRFRQWSFTKILIFKTLLYTAVIYIVTVGLATISGLLEGRKLSELPTLLGSSGLLILVVYSLVIYGLLLFFLQINNLLGEGILWKFIRGKYHKPREEERIFMFLDMKSSTTIAEQLGMYVSIHCLMNFSTRSHNLYFRQELRSISMSEMKWSYLGDGAWLKNSNCLKTFSCSRKTCLSIVRITSKILA
jgi:hypothetical protein